MGLETRAIRDFNALWAAIFLCGFPGIIIGLSEGWMAYFAVFLPLVFLVVALIAGQRPWLWLVKGAGIFGTAVALGILTTFLRPPMIWEALLLCAVSGLVSFAGALVLGGPGTLIVAVFWRIKQR